MSNPVRVRFAPSPTGFLHLGGARTAMLNWLLARSRGGQFILRIEDTDVERSTEASVDQILDSLKWLGLDWDEGPFYQSQRLPMYREHLDRLWAEGKIYPGFESPEELDAERVRAMAEKRNPIYNRASYNLPKDEVARRMDEGVPFVWRFKVPDEGHTDVPETLMSGDADCKFENSTIGDFIITRPGTLANPGMPLYNFVCVVDDADMKITHVIRGVEHLSNAAKQVLLYEAFGYSVPSFTHLPLIMKNGKKMSKRDADTNPMHPVSISARRDLGYLQEATVNFLSLMGWSHPDGIELYSRENLLQKFGLDRLQKANANFDEDKYLFQNGHYIRTMPREEIVRRVRPFLAKAGMEAPGRDDVWYAEVIGLEIERCKLLSEFPQALEYFFKAPTVWEEKGVAKFLNGPEAGALVREVATLLGGIEPFTKEPMEAAVRAMSEAKGLGMGKIAQPIRLCVSGRTASPGLFEVLELLGRDEVLRRIDAALAEAGV